MATFKLLCTSNDVEAYIRLEEKLVGVSWECIEGAEVWGTPWKGTALGPLLADGSMQLSTTDYLYDCKALKLDAEGTGDHQMATGTFPEGTFNWKVVA